MKNARKKLEIFKNILNFTRMHFGHPRTITTFKNRNFLKIWVFQGFPYNRLGPDLAILSPFWGKKFQNPCKKCPSHGQKNLKIFLFFKNVPNSPRIHFGHFKTITNYQKPLVSEFSSLFQSKWYTWLHFVDHSQ